jgi:tetratricopeptide (TPR) repeat protein
MGLRRTTAVLRTTVAVVTLAGMLVACGSGEQEELCRRGDQAMARGQLTQADEAYSQARRSDPEGCGEEGLQAVVERRNEAFVQASSAAGAEARRDLTAAIAAYEKALSLDASNADALAGLARVSRRPSSVAAQPVTTASPPPTSAAPSVTATGIEPPARAAEPATSGTGGPRLQWWLLLLVLLVVGLAAACFTLVNRAGGRLRRLEEKVGLLGDRIDGLEQSVKGEATRRATDTTALTQALDDTKTELTRETDAVGRLVAGQQAQLMRLRDLIDRAVAPEESVVFLGPDPGAREAAASPGGTGSGSAASAELTTVDVHVAVVPGQEPGTGRLVVQRMRQATPVEFRAAVLDSLSREREPAAAREAVATLEEAFYDALSERLVDDVWPTVSEYWITPVSADIADVADRLAGMDGLQDQWHDLFLGTPVREIGEGIGLTRAPLGVVEATAGELPLPGDRAVRGVKHVLQFTGVVVGLVTGNPLLANACVKSFAYDVARRAVAHSAMEAVHAVFTPVREFTRPGNTSARTTSGTPADLRANLQRTARVERLRRDGPDPPSPGGPGPPRPEPGSPGPHNTPGVPGPGTPGRGYYPEPDVPGTRPGRDDEPGTGFGISGP